MKKDCIEKKQAVVNGHVRIAKKFIACARYIAHDRCYGTKEELRWKEALKPVCLASSLLEDMPITDINYTSIRKMLLNAEKHISRARECNTFTTYHDLLEVSIEHLSHALSTIDKRDARI